MYQKGILKLSVARVNVIHGNYMIKESEQFDGEFEPVFVFDDFPQLGAVILPVRCRHYHRSA